MDEQYLNLVNEIIQYGEEKDTRAGKTRSLFGKQLRFNLKDGLPMLTTKKMFTKGVLHELLWFIKGDTNIKYLVDNGVHIWDDDAYRHYLGICNIESTMSKEEFINAVKEEKTFAFVDKENEHMLLDRGELKAESVAKDEKDMKKKVWAVDASRLWCLEFPT